MHIKKHVRHSMRLFLKSKYMHTINLYLTRLRYQIVCIAQTKIVSNDSRYGIIKISYQPHSDEKRHENACISIYCRFFGLQQGIALSNHIPKIKNEGKKLERINTHNSNASKTSKRSIFARFAWAILYLYCIFLLACALGVLVYIFTFLYYFIILSNVFFAFDFENI